MSLESKMSESSIDDLKSKYSINTSNGYFFDNDSKYKNNDICTNITFMNKPFVNQTDGQEKNPLATFVTLGDLDKYITKLHTELPSGYKLKYYNKYIREYDRSEKKMVDEEVEKYNKTQFDNIFAYTNNIENLNEYDATKQATDGYDPNSGLTINTMNEMITLMHHDSNIFKNKLFIFDWDRTFTVIEGMMLLPASYCINKIVIERNMCPKTIHDLIKTYNNEIKHSEQHLTIEHYLLYLFGGFIRMKKLVQFLKLLMDITGKDNIYILTANASFALFEKSKSPSTFIFQNVSGPRKS